MARRKKAEVIEETVITEVIEEPAKKPEMVAEVKEIIKEEKKTVRIAASRVNVRKSPSLLGEVQKVAIAGDRFSLVKDGDDGFYEVICEGQHAFVMKSYAELI